jgi:hypothetical protein
MRSKTSVRGPETNSKPLSAPDGGMRQCIGPLLAGALSDTPSGVRLGLLVSVVILALAAVIAALRRDAEQRVT